ncbi:MAG: nitroreductase family deazaflavin-dependent oxidoreductase [Actinobacteria bacterium]|nr:nitroreductase family deazaflavin-dependent oxidoreductase [Actinomycetota bacterium]
MDDEYEPSPQQWVRDQVEQIESSGGTEGTMLRGVPVIVVTSRGARTGKLRKNPVMRVEHEGSYAAIASKGGAPDNPVWYHNLRADPHVEVQDGPQRCSMVAHLAEGDERSKWWTRAVEVWPAYADYQTKTDREIPVFILERA